MLFDIFSCFHGAVCFISIHCACRFAIIFPTDWKPDDRINQNIKEYKK